LHPPARRSGCRARPTTAAGGPGPCPHRLLARRAEVRERRDQLRHPRYAAPELLVRRPNELWSWDITKLLGPAKWTYF